MDTRSIKRISRYTPEPNHNKITAAFTAAFPLEITHANYSGALKS